MRKLILLGLILSLPAIASLRIIDADQIRSSNRSSVWSFPNATDSLLGAESVQWMSNKTIDANANTISNLTNSNLSGSAAVSNANLAAMNNSTVKGNVSGTSATPSDLTAGQLTAMIDVYTGDTGSADGTKGAVPAPAAGDVGLNKFLHANGGWSVVSSDHGGLSGLSDDDHTQYAILAGRSGGQSLYGGTASNDSLVLYPNNQDNGSVFIGGNVRVGGQDGRTGTYAALGIKAKSDTNGEHIQLEGPGTSSVRFWYQNVRSTGDMFFYNPGANTVGLWLAQSGLSGVGNQGPSFQWDIAGSNATTTFPTSYSAPQTLPALTVRNFSTTDGNFSPLYFGGSAAQVYSAIVGFNDDHTAHTGHLEFWTGNAGTLGQAVTIGSDSVVAMKGYTAGAAVFDSAGVVSSVAPGTSGNVLTSNGTTWVSQANSGGTVGDSNVYVDSGNGRGSTNTRVRRFSNIRNASGSDITYADSAANGGSFTINTNGTYNATYCDGTSSGASNIAISVDGTALTTDASSITYAQGLRAVNYIPNGAYSCVSTAMYLLNGSVVRAQEDNVCDSTNQRVLFSITRVN